MATFIFTVLYFYSYLCLPQFLGVPRNSPNKLPPFLHNSIAQSHRPREGNGTPFQYSCLENPRDRGAWWAAVYGVAQSGTQLKRLSSSSSSPTAQSRLLPLSQASQMLKCHERKKEGRKRGKGRARKVRRRRSNAQLMTGLLYIYLI